MSMPAARLYCLKRRLKVKEKLMKTWILILMALIMPPPAIAGFISSNGMSLPSGIICQESEQVQIQVKLEPNLYEYRLRRVDFSGSVPVVTELTGKMHCEQSRYRNEPTIENRCESSEDSGPSTLQVTPHRDRILITASSPFLPGTGQIWFNFAADQCIVELNELVLPLH
jgi:hypothetical protein